MAEKEGGGEKLDLDRLTSNAGPEGEQSPPPDNPFKAPENQEAVQVRRKSFVDQFKSVVGAGSSREGVGFADAEGGDSTIDADGQPAPYRRLSVLQMGKAILFGEVEHDEDLESAESPWKPGGSSDFNGKPKRIKTENAKWSDPKFDPMGKSEHDKRDFKRPDDWWLSAEQAVELLEAERRGLKKDFSEKKKPAAILNSMMAANRLVTQGLKTMVNTCARAVRLL
eukprot:2163782-Rhodomonas_salina.1